MTSFILIALSLYHFVVLPSIFQLESLSLRAAAVLKHLLCCSSLTRLRGGEIHDVRSNSPESKSLWSEQRPLWIKMIRTTNVVQHINRFKVAKIDQGNLSCDIMWSLFWRAAISRTSWRLVRLVFALALSSLERPPIYGQYFCNLVNSKHQQVVARPWWPWWPWPYLKFFQQPSNLLAFNNKTQLYKAIWCEKLVWSC